MSDGPSPMLMSVEELAARLGAEGGPGSVTVLDCRFLLSDPDAGEQDHLDEHVPGALYAHLDRDLSDLSRPGCGRHPLPPAEDFHARLARWGVRHDRPVVCYDAGGGGVASRAWWLLRNVGHPDVRLLDGGFATWDAEGLPLESGPVEADGSDEAWGWGEMPSMDTDELVAALDAGEVLLVDARGAERFRGDVEPLDRVAGHIPGAVNHPLTDNLVSALFKPVDELRALWQARLGATPPERVVHSCGSGVTACHNLFAMTAAGLPGSVLYWPSWSGWIADEARPVAVGDA